MRETPRRRSVGPLLAAGLLAPWALAAAQPATAPSAYSEAVDVEVVNVDVYVTDRAGNPVTDLTREEFILLEDGKRVEIDYFYSSGESAGGRLLPADDAVEGVAPASADRPGEEAGRRDPPHVVVFVDNVNITPANRKRVLGRLRGFLDRVTAGGARVMVVTHDGSPNVRLGFSDDAQEIAAALAELEGLSVRGFDRLSERRAILTSIEQLDQSLMQIAADRKAQEGSQAGSISERPLLLESELASIVGQIRMYAETRHRAVVDTLASLAGFVELLGELPGRKAIVHVSDGLAVRPGQEMIYALQESYQDGARLARVATAGPDGQESRSFSDRSVSGVRAFGSEIATYDATRQYRQLLALANAGRVTFYTINGAGGGDLIDAEMSGGEALVFSTGAAGFQALAASTDQEGVSLMAEATGGLALSGAGVESFLDRMVTDMTAYYSLGFVPAGTGDDAYHELEVRLKRKGLAVRHREGYRLRRDPGVAQRTLSALLLGFEDNPHGLVLEVTKQEHSEEESLVHMLLEVPIEALSLTPADGLHVAAGTVYVVSRAADGPPSPLRKFPFAFEIPDAELAEARRGSWGIQMILSLTTGRHDVAVALSDKASGAGSIVRTTIDVRQWGDPFGP